MKSTIPCPKCDTPLRKKLQQLRPNYCQCDACGHRWYEYPGFPHKENK